MTKQDEQSNKRSPVIVVMGHVDHGKTALLDFIRKTNFIDKEAGGITQSIGAYEIEYKGNKITFIDTPGHEAFSQMRARGAHVADLAILIVAADDGVKQQTKEAVKHILEAKIPYIVAINKIDKPTADIQRTKTQLSESEVFLEGMGGDISYQEISAKNGDGINDLLDLLLIAVELEDLSCDPETDGSGVVIEAHIDPQRGNTITAIIEDGAVKKDDEIATPSAKGRVRIMENHLGKNISEATPSSPVLIVGFDSLPKVGEEFIVGATPTDQSTGEQPQDSEQPDDEAAEGINEKFVFNVIIKSNVSGSVEALRGIFENLDKPNTNINIVNTDIGEVTDGDVGRAIATKAVIAAFNVGTQKAAIQLAKNNEVSIVSSKIIYEVVKAIEDKIEQTRPKVPDGNLEVLAVFRKIEKRQVIGGKVLAGLIKNNSEVIVARNENRVGVGKIVNLQHNKKDEGVVEEGKEAGILFEGAIDIRKGDELWYFETQSA